MATERAKPEQPTLAFAAPLAFEAWLSEHHDASDGIWLKFAKKASGIATIVYAEALDIALCYGWIDGQVKALDADFYLQRFTPRRARSQWSQRNREHVERLTKAKRMQPAGLAEVQRAKADGRWDAAYASPSRITVPDDLQAALDAQPAARDFFATISASSRYAILYRIHQAKRPETRARRIAQFVAMLADGRTVH